MKLICEKKNNKLISTELYSLKDGYYTVEIRKIRSIQNHRLLFVTIAKYMEASGRFKSEEECLTVLKLALGYTEEVEYHNKKYIVPKSISFSEMGQDEFYIFFRRAVELMAADLGVTEEELLEE